MSDILKYLKHNNYLVKFPQIPKTKEKENIKQKKL